MRILAVGGGSGGHVTPIVAVLRELKKRDSTAEIRFWCDRKFASQANSIVGRFDNSIRVEKILAGKFRRYHTLPLWRQLLRPFSIVLPNLRDILLIVGGFLQSFVKLLLWKPDVVFTKGGFVCLPVGLAAWLLRIPLVIHDSDSHPGLTNRILAKFATAIATGADLRNYPYPTEISRYIGVPINPGFKPVSLEARMVLKERLGFIRDRPLLVVTGGGLGSENINQAVAKCLSTLLETVNVVLISGNNAYNEMRAETPQGDVRFQLHAFIHNMADYLAAADIVATRAGATTLLELAALAKPTILIPSPYLSGGHQLKNATELSKHNAVEIIDEIKLDTHPQVLVDTVTSILTNKDRMATLANNLHSLAKPRAASDMANMIIDSAKKA